LTTAETAEIAGLIAKGVSRGEDKHFKDAGKLLETIQEAIKCDNRQEIDDYCAQNTIKGIKDTMTKVIICRATVKRDSVTGVIAYDAEPCHRAFTVFPRKGSSYPRHVQEIHLGCPKYTSRNAHK
jgi:hypothetical protein